MAIKYIIKAHTAMYLGLLLLLVYSIYREVGAWTGGALFLLLLHCTTGTIIKVILEKKNEEFRRKFKEAVDAGLIDISSISFRSVEATDDEEQDDDPPIVA